MSELLSLVQVGERPAPQCDSTQVQELNEVAVGVNHGDGGLLVGIWAPLEGPAALPLGGPLGPMSNLPAKFGL
jgi:hypothetical protein